jgi:hypothetical protein
MTRMDSFLISFVAALQKNEAVGGCTAFVVLSGSIAVAVRVSVHTKSIPENVRVTHVSSAFRAGHVVIDNSYEATIVNSRQVTNRHAGRPAVFDRALQGHDEWCRAPSRFFGDDAPERTRWSVHLLFEAAAPGLKG